MFGIVIDSRGGVYQVRVRGAAWSGPSWRRWLGVCPCDCGGCGWSAWFPLRHYPYPWTTVSFEPGRMAVA